MAERVIQSGSVVKFQSGDGSELVALFRLSDDGSGWWVKDPLPVASFYPIIASYSWYKSMVGGSNGASGNGQSLVCSWLDG